MGKSTKSSGFCALTSFFFLSQDLLVFEMARDDRLEVVVYLIYGHIPLFIEIKPLHAQCSWLFGTL